MTKRTEARWRGLVEEQGRSGLTVREFAASRGLSAATLYWWRSRLRVSHPVRSELVPVEIVDQRESKPGSAAFELQLGEDLTVRVLPGFAESDLRRLLGVLRTC